jgi:Heterokaryon incompatibility protein (HET)
MATPSLLHSRFKSDEPTKKDPPRVHPPEGKPLLYIGEGEQRSWKYGSQGADGALRLFSVEKLLAAARRDNSHETCSIDLYEWEQQSLAWPRDGVTQPKDKHKNPPGMPAYVAISHTWTPSEDVVKRSKRAERPLLIETGLSKPHEISWLGLVQAAIAAKVLKCDYLWLDLLCLDQLSNDDKKAQIMNMHRIYSNATAVVVMFGGVSAAQGVDQLSTCKC